MMPETAPVTPLDATDPRPPVRRRRVALANSGLGNAFGGIGVVAEVVATELGRSVDLDLWRHHHDWARTVRAPAFVTRVAAGALQRPDFVFYSHVDLARVHHLVPWLRRVPYVALLCGVEVWRPLDPMRRRALAHASLLLSISEATLRTARSANPWLPEATVTWLGVRRAIGPLTPAGERDPVALIVGRMDASERQKGHDPILDAWPAIRAAVPNAELLIAGDGNDKARLIERVSRERIAGVTFTGSISDSARDALYRRTRLHLFPSLQEGFGLAAVEAAAVGAAGLGIAGTVMQELFPAREGCVLVARPTGACIAEAAIPILTDPALATKLGAEAKARVESVFLEEHFLSRLRQALRPLL